jgi:hypothetical protein
MSPRARVLALIALLAGSSTACLDRSSPTITHPDLNAPAAQTPVGFPALTRPGQVFRLLGPAPDPGRLASRYVLYDDGTFALQYSGPGLLFEIAGTYWRSDSTITFVYNAASNELWIATGTLQLDELRVHYNSTMQQSEFIDATYQRVSDGSQLAR